ncbi:MAG: non-hydrolyzing UDP-N-acetylglucosamine 2-epimerase [Candidatus Thorarchaeota archaeon]
MSHVLIFIGTRPEITKMAPIIRKIDEKKLQLTLIHSGQHYDYQMSKIFLEELELPNIAENLEVGSGTHAEQTAKLILGYEKTIQKYKPNIVLALGDTNSVVAAGIVCSKLNIPFGHIEAGIRSFDMTMPEEINRRFAAIGAAIHFAPSEQAIVNLYYEGIDPKRIYFTGNTAVDATIEHAPIAKRKSNILKKLNLPKDKPLIVVTTHRPSNVDSKETLESICKALNNLSEFSIVFPVHPRTMKKLDDFKLKHTLSESKHIFLTEPLGYLDFLVLMQESAVILTDSGGLQEEAITLKKPCITLRTNTERPETIRLGVNFLVGNDYNKIISTVREVYASKEIDNLLHKVQNPYGDGHASERIVDLIIEHCEKNDLYFLPPTFYHQGSAEFQLIQLKSDIDTKLYEQKNQVIITMVYDLEGIPKSIPSKIPKGWFIRIQK